MKTTLHSVLTSLTLVVGLGFASAVLPIPAHAVDNMSSSDAPDLASPRAKIKAMDYSGAIVELKKIADTNQHADVYNLLGYSLRKSGDFKTALTYYTKALEFDADHKAAREYLGELYVETGNIDKAKEQLVILSRLCPGGCEEREDLQKAIATTTAAGK
jgi:tetratricopeptide (TPR) repeat protein